MSCRRHCRDLMGVNVVLVRDLGNRLAVGQGLDSHIGLELR
jgi:hypothetical protein